MRLARPVVQPIVRPVVRGITDAFNGEEKSKSMRLVISTTGASEIFTLPCQDVGVFNALVNWGDGTESSTITAFNDGDLSHTYLVAGTYTIKISGVFPNIYFNNGTQRLKLKRIENIGETGLIQLDNGFDGCTNLSYVAGHADTSLVDTYQSTFNNCSGLTTFNLSAWNFESGANFTNFLNGVTLPTEEYDALLIDLDNQDIINNLTISFGASKYTGGGSAAAARANLITNDLLTIIDGGIA